MTAPEVQSQISDAAGVLSVLLWILAQVPQAVKNHRTRSVDDISVHWLLLWLLGDSCNLIGSTLSPHHINSQLLLGTYFVAMDIVLLAQWFVFRTTLESMRSPILRFTSAATVGLLLLYFAGSSRYTAGQIFGWLSAVMYLMSRVPQAYRNCVRKSVDDLSWQLFALAIGGNLTFALSVVSFSTESNYLSKQAPWLIGSIGTVSFDMFLLWQLRHYGSGQPRSRSSLNDSDFEGDGFADGKRSPVARSLTLGATETVHGRLPIPSSPTV
eukprot:TRINITY_DN24352_c0_g1_i1.p1 TRINITY_DN24352_c0_g1~~TRINITY_DN24352_c0_g1_i1.p1  ORF type:complete len:269 (-),score=29.05 TRINITY_DN24352_c0_g1_i1:7-813(-)